MKFGIKTITGIFCSGPYVWEVASSEGDSTGKIKELHEGSLLDQMFYPGMRVSIAGNKFKVTRWGIGRLPMSGNSFVHVFIGEIFQKGSKTIIRGRFRLNLLVFCFMAFWLTMAFFASVFIAVTCAKAFLLNGDRSKLSGMLFGIAFPLAGTLLMLGARRLAAPNEKEILDGLKAKFGEPILKPE